MPKGHPHGSWEHVGALWPAVPASDDAIQPLALEWEDFSRRGSSQLCYEALWFEVCISFQHLHAFVTGDAGHFEGM